MKMFSIRDAKAENYSNPQYFRTSGEAIRALQQAVEDPNNQIGKYPEDFSMWLVGEFDEEHGLVVAEEVPKPVINAIDLVRNDVE